MTSKTTTVGSTARRYSSEEKAQAVRLVHQLREELGITQGTVTRIARQLGYGPESVRRWVKQAEFDVGEAAGLSSVDDARLREPEQENRELRRANVVLKSASVFFAAELDLLHR